MYQHKRILLFIKKMKANAFVAIVAAKSTRFLSYILFRFNASSDEIPRKEHSIKTLSDTAKSL